MSRRETPRGYWPKFDSNFLSVLVTALKKRSKSLKHSVRDYSCERVRENTGGVGREKLELSFRKVAPHPVRITFYCWDDRWMWLDIRQPAKSGWNFEWQHTGRIGAAGPVAVAALLRQSIQLPYGIDLASSLNFLGEKWQATAVTGPKGEVT